MHIALTAAAILAILVLLVLAPPAFRLLLAAARLFGLSFLSRRLSGSSDIVPESARLALPLHLYPSTLIGMRQADVEGALGRPTYRFRLRDEGDRKGIVAMTWNHTDPKLSCHFQAGTCIDAGVDKNWHKRPASADELLQRFMPSEKLLGLSCNAIEEIAGTRSGWSSFDYGMDVWLWKRDDVRVEVWAQDGVSTGVEVFCRDELVKKTPTPTSVIPSPIENSRA